MATQKVSVTLEGAAIERARQLAGPRGLSSYLDDALHEKLARDARQTAFIQFLDELEKVDPTPPDVQAHGRERAAAIRRRVSG